MTGSPPYAIAGWGLAAAVLASLYPATTVILARLVLDERVSGIQAVGITAVLASIPLIVA
jgi:drug/metabolite transporter (DMT)-like permease